MRSEEVDKKVAEALSSLDGVQRATAPDYFYTRLQARMEKELMPSSPAWVPFGKPVWLIATLLLCLVMNAVMIKQTKQSKNSNSSANTSSSLQSFAAEYELSSTVNY